MKILCIALLGCNLLISSCSVSQKKFLSEGIVLYKTIMADDGFKDEGERYGNDGFQMEERYLFKGNFLIFEQKFLNSNSDADSITKSVAICNYIFIDLPAKVCYVYRHLSDTAQPVFRYKLTESSPGWGLLISSDGNFDSFTSKQLTDTVVNGIATKRMQLIKKEFDIVSFYTYYGSSDFPKTIFRFHPHIDSLLQPAVPFRVDFRTNDTDKFSIGELKVIRTKLDEKQLSIFKNWERNAKASTSGIYDMMEGIKVYGWCTYQEKF